MSTHSRRASVIPPRDPAPWSGAVEAHLERLHSTPAGLTGREAERRLAVYGANHAAQARGATWPRLLASQLGSPLVLLLLAALVLSLILGETTDALILLAIVLGSTTLGFAQEFRASRAMDRLLAVIETQATVLRDGATWKVPPEAIVPGDVVVFAAGAAVPADCRIVRSTDLFVDESTLTGESFPAEKKADALPRDTPLVRRTNMLYRGSHIVSGLGHAVVVATGGETAFGHIAERLRLRPPATAFERGLRRFGAMLIQITMFLVLAIFAINVYLHRPPVDALLFSLALAVGLTPELLPAIVSLTLARGAERMARAQVIVRRLNSIEDFGSMNVLCSDKTGTLTEGRVSVIEARRPDGSPSTAVLEAATLNAVFESGFPNPIDDALRRQAGTDLDSAVKVDEVPYDFVRKRLSVVVERPEGTERRHTMITKGAYRQVLAACSTVAWPTERGPDTVAVAAVHAALDHQFAAASAGGRRVLAVATKDVTDDPVINKDDEVNMTFLGFVVFEDRVKPGARETIAALRSLGVRTKIITGDNRLVAATLGAQLGVDTPEILTGDRLATMSDAALMQRAGAVDVFAETEPNQKERILTALRKAGNVVGFLGDGINDASALHAADVGISVKGAVDVAKEAADLVLLEHDLGVLVDGVREGRRTFANTLKYIYITTSANFGNMLSMAAASLFLPFLPLLPKQILLNNFLSDLPSMTVATDNVDQESVDRPQRWDVRIIRNFMFAFGLGSTVFDCLTFAMLLLMFRAQERQFQTAWFIESLMTELFIVLVIRTRRPAWRSRPSRVLTVTTLLVAGTTVFLPYTPVGAGFGFVPLPGSLLLALLLVTAAYLTANELAKRWFLGRLLTRGPADAAPLQVTA